MKISHITSKPGVYIFRDKDGSIIYVGKAVRLKERVRSYFSDSSQHSIKTQKLVSSIASIDFILTENEEASLLKENELIKKYQPKYNILLRDDKTYPYIKITTNEDFPTIFFTRKFEYDGSDYFGPYPNVGEARKAAQYVIDKYKIRQCKQTPLKQKDKPCLNYQIGKCLGPCIGKISKKEYGDRIKLACDFLNGKQREIINKLQQEMNYFYEKLEFEKAGEKKELIKAAQALKRVSNIRKPQIEQEVLASLKNKLLLKNFPAKIEAFDISNISGEMAVGSMIVFEQGKPAKKYYRKFKIKTIKGANDTAMMKEMVFRRYKRLKEDDEKEPDLVLVDGGRGQLNTVVNQLNELGIFYPDVIGLAKRLELVFKFDKKEPIILNKYSEEKYLLQRVRDEAHRFAVTYHRNLRSKKISDSELLKIKGIGENKAHLLIKKFGSVEKIRNLSYDDVASASGISSDNAKSVVEYFKNQVRS
ncbi:excinuclease ABC subunit UvrC, partial [bacterium]|nr:excinuclease ABC subunit UvrC [bacterium]